MRRVDSPERPGWRTKAAAEGFVFHSPAGRRYWREDARYEFTLKEIEETIEAPTAEIEAMVLDIVPDLIGDELYFLRLGFERRHWDWIAESWRRRDPAVYGRYDLAYDGQGPAKLLEAQVDTPTSLYEAAVWQWGWLEEMIAAGALPADADQFNSLHEQLVEQWRHLRLERWTLDEGARLHLASLRDSGDGELIVEDADTVAYMAETAAQAGFDPKLIFVEDIRYELDGAGFVDADGEPIRRIFKLYPWEWMLGEQFGGLLLDRRERTRWVEPAWKLLLSNKQLLVVLWEMFRGHPNLLPASAEPLVGTAQVRKPRLGREGANVTVLDADGAVVAENGGV